MSQLNKEITFQDNTSRLRIEQKQDYFLLYILEIKCGRHIEKVYKFKDLLSYTYDCHTFQIIVLWNDIDIIINFNCINDRDKNQVLDLIRPLL